MMTRGRYMLSNCKKSCGKCSHANYTSWVFEKASGQAYGALRLGDHCLDTAGQLPPAHGGTPNVLHTAPCDPTKSGQRWLFNGTRGLVHSPSGVTVAVEGSAEDDAALCLRVTPTWLWATPVVSLDGRCEPGGQTEWTLHPNGTLQSVGFGCVGLSADSGPPTTIWAKPLTKGRVALLAINGADASQTIGLNFAELLALLHPSFVGGKKGSAAEDKKWAVRDVWAGKDLGEMSELSREVPPHDCVLVVLG